MPASPSHIPRGVVGTVGAFKGSLSGLRAAWLYEASFRLEAVLAAVLVPLGLVLDEDAIERLLLILAVLVTELLNSAIEAAIDRHGPECHELSGRAKDLGSAAVLVA
ncbi:diacylglycerol kinase [Pseudoxanthomonas broegbernensis]|uniref:Diacylglycerol kinase n=1 Tax=Pseudoxanthomonas broegbernensis TaxID=83619 RepID=A0A7V8GND2_9GAMM|nr:diacylglycerol kinase [Pseudoxanthomonas broegbernensis]KAF1686937.1 diacylglycerol kinase [Pseudoxanthomonas broegbernensis]